MKDGNKISGLAALLGAGPQETGETMSEGMHETPQSETITSITIPEGMKTPEGHKDGDAFQGTFRGYIKDGKLNFRSINNIPLPGNEEEETVVEEESEMPEEEVAEDKMSMEAPVEEPPVEDPEDKMFKKRKKSEDAFKKAFH